MLSSRFFSDAQAEQIRQLTQLADRLQHHRGFDSRSALHDAVLNESGADELLVDEAVYDYCVHENQKAERGEEPFSGVRS